MKEFAKELKILEIKVAGMIGIIDFIFQEIPHNATVHKKIESCINLEFYPFPEILLKTTIDVRDFNEMSLSENDKANFLEYATFFKENKTNTLQEKLVFVEKFLQFNGKKTIKFFIEYKEDFLSNFICKKLDEANIKHSAFEFKSNTALTGTFFSRRKYIRQTLKFTLNNFFGANIDFIIRLDKSTNDLLCKYEVETPLNYINLLNDLNKNPSTSIQSTQIENSFVARFSITDFQITHPMTESTLYRKDFEDDISYINKAKEEIEYFVANYNFVTRKFHNSMDKINFYLKKIEENKNILSKMSFDKLDDTEQNKLIEEYFKRIIKVQNAITIKTFTNRINLKIMQNETEYSFYPLKNDVLKFIREQKSDFENDKDFIQSKIDEPISEFTGITIEFVEIQADSFRKNKADLKVESFYLCTKSLPQKVIKQIIENFGDTYKTPTYDQRFVAMKQFFATNVYPLENLLIK